MKLILTLTSLSPSHSLAETSRKALKSKNQLGSPIRLQSKLLAIISDPADPGAVYVAESAGSARRVVLDVGEIEQSLTLLPTPPHAT